MTDISITKSRGKKYLSGAAPMVPAYVVGEDPIPLNPPGSGPAADFVPYEGASRDVDLGANDLSVNALTLDPTPATIPTAQGSIYFDADEQTVAAILNGTVQKIGEDMFFQVKNQSGVTIPKGTSVRFDGVVGASGRIKVVPFLADGTYPSMYFVGLLNEELLDGGDGKAYYGGKIRGMDTSAFPIQTILYCSTTVAGALQSTAPISPNNIISVAAVIAQSATVGTLLIRPQIGSNINNDEGVKIVTPTTLDILQLQANGLWENKSLLNAGIEPAITAGTTAQYWRGDKTFQTLNTLAVPELTNLYFTEARVRATLLTGYVVGTNTPVTPAHTVLSAFQDVQGQINARVSGGGTVNYLQKITSTGVIGNSQIFDNGTNVGIGTTNPISKFDIKVSDSVVGMRVRAVTGVLRIYPYFDATYGTVIEALTTAETGYVPFTFSGSKFVFNSGNTGFLTTAPTNTIDVNGTARIRTIANLGTAATNVMVPSATGVVSLRTVAEFRGDIGAQVTIAGTLTDTYVATIVAGVPTWTAPSAGSSNWTVVGSDIYRNSAVAVGRITIPTNATFAVQSISATTTHKFLQLLNNAGNEVISLQENGWDFRVGNSITTNTSNQGVTFKGPGTTISHQLLRVLDGSDNIAFQINGNGTFEHIGVTFKCGSPTTNLAADGATFKGSSITSGEIFKVNNSSDIAAFTILGNGDSKLLRDIITGGATTNLANFGSTIKGGVANDLNQVFRVLNSSNTILFEIAGLGQITYRDGGNHVFGTTTGSKLGTATTQKFAFWNKTPIIQPTTAITGAALAGGGGTAITDTHTFGGYTLQQIAAILINTGLTA